MYVQRLAAKDCRAIVLWLLTPGYHHHPTGECVMMATKKKQRFFRIAKTIMFVAFFSTAAFGEERTGLPFDLNYFMSQQAVGTHLKMVDAYSPPLAAGWFIFNETTQQKTTTDRISSGFFSLTI